MSPFGTLLRAWRRERGESQLSLALRAGVSARHLSFIETGRSRPSREMVLLLGQALDLPLRERNRLMEAAGFASVFRESSLEEPRLAQMKRVLAFLLERLEPYPAVVVNGRYDVVMRNEAALRVFAPFAGPGLTAAATPPNLLRLVTDEKGVGGSLIDGRRVADAMLRRAAKATGRPAQELIAELGIEAPAPEPPTISEADELLLPVHLKNGSLELRLLSTFTTLGGVQDVTLQELQVECFLPADEASDRVIRELAGGEPQ